ncbi:MAG: hypothetical protein GY884_04280, partial [Proteobacteria bacterium]|nr:hypothetical protein [Pseudomonadota bacterium]
GSGLGQPQLPDFAIDPTREQLLAIWNRKHTHVGTIEARMVGFDGRLGATFRFRTSGSALGPAAVVRTRANAFLVAWSEFLEDGSNLLLGQRVVDGRPHGLVVPMTEATMTYHRRVKLGQLGESRAVFTWSETDPVTLASYGAYFSLVDERLSLLVSRVRIDDDRAGHQPEVAGCADEFVVAWDQDGDGLFAGRDVMIQLFSSDGAPLSDITQANNHIANDQKQPDLFVDCDSGRVVGGGLTWDSKNQDGDGRGVFARWFIVD